MKGSARNFQEVQEQYKESININRYYTGISHLFNRNTNC